MRLRKTGKILLYCFAGLLGLVALLMSATKLALDRAPAYEAEIKQWVHAQTGYPIGFAGVSPSFRWYGPELHFEQLELRSKDNRRVLARAAGGRIAADIWQLLSSGKLFEHPELVKVLCGFKLVHVDISQTDGRPARRHPCPAHRRRPSGHVGDARHPHHQLGSVVSVAIYSSGTSATV